MARTALVPQRITPDGLELLPEPANVDGHSMPLRRDVALLVSNASAGAVTATIPTPAKVAGLDVAERTVNVPAGADRYIAVGNDPVYRQADGTVHVDISPITSVTVAVLAL